MAFAGHHNDHALGVNELSYDEDHKGTTEHISDLSLEHGSTTTRKREAPPLVQALSADDRDRLERALVRKIDIRLLPTIVVMYILNYLDRNNIAAAKLAGLVSDLHLTSVQYNVQMPLIINL